MKQKNEQGSSLIEVIMAMVILAMLVAGLNTFLVAMINSNAGAKDTSVATASGTALLEKFRTVDYGTILTGTDVVNNKYVRAWTVTDDGTKKMVSLVVFWPQTAARHSVALSTFIAKP